MPQITYKISSGQPPLGVACHRAHPPMCDLNPQQGAPVVIPTNKNCAGSSGGVAKGGPITTTSMLKHNESNDSSCSMSINHCGHSSCKLCNDFSMDHTFTSTVTGRTYHIKSHENLNCNSQNIIYLVTCNYCKLQYVGETSKSLKTRFNNHRSASKMENTQKILYQHFKQSPCNESGFKVQILEKLHGTGHLDNGKINPEETQKRTKAEEFWISTLQTIFPYGLNDRFKNIDFRNRQKTDYIARYYGSMLARRNFKLYSSHM